MTFPDRPPSSAHVRRLHSFFKLGILIVLSLGAVLLYVDWRTGSQFTRPWVQVVFTVIGLLILGHAVFRSKLNPPRRMLVGAAGLLMLLAVADSVNGQQEIFTVVVVLLLLWTGTYADITLQLQHRGLVTVRRKAAASIAILATLIYFGSACYSLFLHFASTPDEGEYHLLFGAAVLARIFIQWMGELEPYGTTLTGVVRICPACGRRNIPERQTCKRCGVRLGAIEQVI